MAWRSIPLAMGECQKKRVPLGEAKENGHPNATRWTATAAFGMAPHRGGSHVFDGGLFKVANPAMHGLYGGG